MKIRIRSFITTNTIFVTHETFINNTIIMREGECFKYYYKDIPKQLQDIFDANLAFKNATQILKYIS